MSQREIVDRYVSGKLSRRSFIQGLVKTGVSLGAAVVYANVLAGETSADPGHRGGRGKHGGPGHGKRGKRHGGPHHGGPHHGRDNPHGRGKGKRGFSNLYR